MSTLKVLIQQPVLPLYRLPVFRALAQHPEIDLTLAFGQAHPNHSHATAESDPFFRTEILTNKYFKEGKLATYQKGLVQLVRSSEYDVVVLGLDPRSFTTILALKAAKKAGHGVVLWGKVKNPTGKFGKVYRYMIDRADSVLFYYEPTIDEYVRLGVPRDKLFAAWNSIDTQEIEKHRLKSFEPSRKAIIHLGRLIPAKKVDLLIRGFALARQKGLDSNLIILGDGPLKPELQALIDSLDLGDSAQIISGVYEEQATAEYFNQAWISMSPGEVGLNIVHSFAYGVPMLLAKGEAHSAEVSIAQEGVNSLWFPGQDPQALAHALLDARNHFDQLKQMSIAGHEYVHANFSAEGMANRMFSAILHAAQESSHLE